MANLKDLKPSSLGEKTPCRAHVGHVCPKRVPHRLYPRRFPKRNVTTFILIPKSHADGPYNLHKWSFWKPPMPSKWVYIVGFFSPPLSGTVEVWAPNILTGDFFGPTFAGQMWEHPRQHRRVHLGIREGRFDGSGEVLGSVTVGNSGNWYQMV